MLSIGKELTVYSFRIFFKAILILDSMSLKTTISNVDTCIIDFYHPKQ
jgi:hypothetical protein